MAASKWYNHKGGAQASPLPSNENRGCQILWVGKPIAGVQTKSSKTIKPRALVFFAFKLLGSPVLMDQRLVNGVFFFFLHFGHLVVILF